MSRKILPVRKPISGGILLSYKCSGECRHCMYACSYRWSNYWIDKDDLISVLRELAWAFRGEYSPDTKGLLGVNYGLHFTGGEPFLNFQLLLFAVEQSNKLGLRSKFVETNCFWCTDDKIIEDRFLKLKEKGLDGVLISANPFVVEHVPFERIERGLTVSIKVFGAENVIVYHPIYYRQLSSMGVKETLKFEEYLRRINPEEFIWSFDPGILLPMGRLPYKLGNLYHKHPAKFFFGQSCLSELTRPWHVHVDCFCNYIPGYCAGISLGDARRLREIVQGVDLEDKPILEALSTDLKKLFEFAKREYRYKELKEGYVSKCHLCLDIRRHIALVTNEFKELRPREFYEKL